MKADFAVLPTLLLIVTSEQFAFANNVPGVQALGAIALMPLAIIIFSLIGGVNTIFNDGNPQSIWKWFGVIGGCGLLILYSVTPETALSAIGVFAICAILRAVHMFERSANGYSKQSEMVRTKRFRLRMAGVGLICSFFILVSTAFVFLVPWDARYCDHTQLLRFLKYQVAYGMQHQRDGLPVFDYVVPGVSPLWNEMRRGCHWRAESKFEVVYYNENHRFVIFLTPHALPIFPFNLITEMPSFRADQTGAIRMCFVHWNGEKCPEEAPVVHIVDPAEIRGPDYWLEPPSDSEFIRSLRQPHKWSRGELEW